MKKKSLGAWVSGWRETSFVIDRMGCVGPQSFYADQKNGRRQNFDMDEHIIL